MAISTTMYEDHYMRLGRAKLHGRWFYNSLNQSLKNLPVNVYKIVESNPNWSMLFCDLYGEDGFTVYKCKNNKKSLEFV